MLLLYPNMTNLDNITHSDVFVAYKKEGETPLECLNRLKDEGFLPFNDKFTYAGRLDPMAEGLMVFLRKEAILDKDKFLGLSKVYEVEVLLGVGTDTGDILGLVNQYSKKDVVFDIKNIQSICESFIGEMEVPYPWYSSKTVGGKPLFEWAREFNSEESDDDKELLLRPMTKLNIKEIEILNFTLLSNSDFLMNIQTRIKKVKGDFRQENILNEWNKLKGNKIEYPVFKIRVKCSSGSYMRTLAELIGEKLNVPALAYSIKRISIGDYNL